MCPKVYTLKKFPEGKIIKWVKRCKKNVKDKQITWKDFEKYLADASIIIQKEQKTFRSFKHELYTIQ